MALAFFDDYSSGMAEGRVKKSVYEIRNYHYDTSKIIAFKKWMNDDAASFLKTNLDVVGIWISTEDNAIISGTNPMKQYLGSANVTWIIRWNSMEERERIREKVFAGEDWQQIWSSHPDIDGYHQIEVKFAMQY
ncbi:hypothetical protein QTP81_11135 [Alteromonas sp. ASW11-36]|uniref:NIPSNAP domain-containing protein n=1 Tax=Alteromonas arenosi TaxID=3055817 RepID=A0ABT7T017_9ALTE|nr:hypothetical protein [Alteromonas sp. ASW11-36]MDM7861152.1 hypothetical protein [Alteromonas sp. ASW11-36]